MRKHRQVTAHTGQHFTARKGARIPKGANVQAIGAALIALYEADGDVRGSRYVEVGRDPDHPFHPTLEWDNDKAGHQYRLQQARNIIASIEVVMVDETGDDSGEHPVPMPVFFSVPSTDQREGRYRTLDDVIRHPEELTAATLALMEKRDALEARLQHLKRRVEGSPDEQIRTRAASLAVALESLAACKLALETTAH
jgi:hypothetical protein